MTGAEIVARARSAIGQDTIYKLGTGVRNGGSVAPWDDDRRCDCSGFVAWCLGTDRHRPDIALYKRYNGGWLSTDAMVHDADSPRAKTGLLTRVQVPMPGDIVVYGDEGGKQGHCGIVSGGIPERATAWAWDLLLAIHCSAGNYRKTGDAIRETAGAFFGKHGAIFARWDV